VTDEELVELIAQIDARIEELEKRCSEGDAKACDLVVEFKELREQFVAYQAQLQEYLTVDEEFEEEDEFDLEEPVDTAAQIAKLAGMLESVNDRITWLESLKGDPEERARLSELTGIDLTQEALDTIIEGAKAEAQFIQNQIDLLQDGTEAMMDPDPVFTAEARDYSEILQVAYDDDGPSLLQLGEHAVAVHDRWY